MCVPVNRESLVLKQADDDRRSAEARRADLISARMARFEQRQAEWQREITEMLKGDEELQRRSHRELVEMERDYFENYQMRSATMNDLIVNALFLATRQRMAIMFHQAVLRELRNQPEDIGLLLTVRDLQSQFDQEIAFIDLNYFEEMQEVEEIIQTAMNLLADQN